MFVIYGLAPAGPERRILEFARAFPSRPESLDVHVCVVGDDLTRALEIATRGVDQPQAAERQGRGVAEPALAHIDQLEATAAEIADKAVGVVDTSDDANSGELCFLGAREHSDRHVEDALGLGDKLMTVLGFARRGGGDGLDACDAHLVDQRAEASKRSKRTGHSIGAEPPSGGQRPAEAAGEDPVRAEAGEHQYMAWRRSYDTAPPPLAGEERPGGAANVAWMFIALE